MSFAVSAALPKFPDFDEKKISSSPSKESASTTSQSRGTKRGHAATTSLEAAVSKEAEGQLKRAKTEKSERSELFPRAAEIVRKKIVVLNKPLFSRPESRPRAQTFSNPSNFAFIRDGYTLRRGEPKMLEIFCSKCNANAMTYQKDGPGRLLRCYLDRIHSPSFHKSRISKFDPETTPHLRCTNIKCFEILGRPSVYQLETRAAYTLLHSKSYFKMIR